MAGRPPGEACAFRPWARGRGRVPPDAARPGPPPALQPPPVGPGPSQALFALHTCANTVAASPPPLSSPRPEHGSSVLALRAGSARKSCFAAARPPVLGGAEGRRVLVLLAERVGAEVQKQAEGLPHTPSGAKGTPHFPATRAGGTRSSGRGSARTLGEPGRPFTRLAKRKESCSCSGGLPGQAALSMPRPLAAQLLPGLGVAGLSFWGPRLRCAPVKVLCPVWRTTVCPPPVRRPQLSVQARVSASLRPS